MPGNTTRHQLPYPVGTDPVASGDDTIKSLAENAEKRIHYTNDFGQGELAFGVMNMGRRAYNLCSYSETVSNGTGYLVIQTNMTNNSTIMSKINITGLMYEPTGATVDIDVKWYPFSDGVQHRWEVSNRGSFCADVQIWSRDSDSKIAIVLTPSLPAVYFNYPKISVDGIFGQGPATESFLEGWSISRRANMTGYTVKQATPRPRPSAEDTGWINLPLINGWTQYAPGSNWDARYRRRGGIVYIQGLLKPPATGSANPICYLPAGFRPYKNTLRGAIDSGAFMRMLYVYTDGNLSIPNGGIDGYSWFSVENVNFPAA